MIIVLMSKNHGIDGSYLSFLEIGYQTFCSQIVFDATTSVKEEILSSVSDKGTVSLSHIKESDFLMREKIWDKKQ